MNLAKIIMNLEKRIFVLESAMKITPDRAELTHPKALDQAKARQATKEVKK